MNRAVVFSFFVFCAFFSIALTSATHARAQAPTAESSRSATTFALVVTSNRSARLSRPDLRYADDDGAKYYEMFSMIAPEANVRLLTTFDTDSAKLFPDLVSKARPPTRAGITAAAAELAKSAAAARSLGPVEFYFVFAGHGDIQGGKGFLDLPDGAFTADDLEAMLKSMPTAHSHVILDSCNSFFLVSSRKPGGRHFVTSDEAAQGLSARLPNVGVFVSTSAEAEVFEWSELQSGVFSHAVRSGIAGAADVNHDGHVSYDELRAFVNVATKDVKNPAFRPQVFARGPGGQGATTLFDLSRAQGMRVTFDENRKRVTIRDSNELPWFDFNKEAGEPALLVLPPRVSSGVSADRHDEAPSAAAPSPIAARGADDLFKSLFARPFGPVAFAEDVAESRLLPPLVLGVSADERERMSLLLAESADSGRRQRIVGGSLRLGINLSVGAIGGVVLAAGIRDKQPAYDAIGGVLIAFGAFEAAMSIREIAGPSFEEESFRLFVDGETLGANTQQIYSLAERRLFYAAEHDRKHRTLARWLGLSTFLAEGALVGLSLANEGSQNRTLLGIGIAGGLIGGALFFDSFFPTTTERMADLWRKDPSRPYLRSPSAFTIRPTLGLGGGGLAGTF